MENILKFIRENYIAVLAGCFFYGLFLTFTYSGNRICDCETTEKYSPRSTGIRHTINHFYHK